MFGTAVTLRQYWINIGDDDDDGDDDNGEEKEFVLTARKYVENQQVLYKSHACVIKSE